MLTQSFNLEIKTKLIIIMIQQFNYNNGYKYCDHYYIQLDFIYFSLQVIKFYNLLFTKKTELKFYYFELLCLGISESDRFSLFYFLLRSQLAKSSILLKINTSFTNTIK